MKTTDHHESVIVVSAEEFESVDFEAPIRDSKNVDCWSLGNLYSTAAFTAKECGNEPAARVFGLLSDIAKINFKPEDRSDPFGTEFSLSGKRFPIPADLGSEQSAVIAELVPTIRNPGLRARLADIVWYNYGKLAAMTAQAIDAYREAVQSVLDREAEFFVENWDSIGKNHESCDLL